MMANVMEQPRIEKVVINIGVGESGERLGKAEKLLEKLTSRKPTRTISKHKNPTWNVRKGEPIGCKVTLRGGDAVEAIKRTLYAKDNMLRPGNFDVSGNVSYGIQEYIDIQGLKYDPEIGIFGMNVNINLERPGYRIGRRKQRQVKVPDHARVTRDEAIKYMEKEFGVKIEEEE
ncbi:MAG: 50S ribosomal protein L5 [Candidatus Altiarchaeales archaeon]|nr:50S ribosomal protein L5 [Candidatus Altiarchaeales archaeon]MBD3416348.1 50S ribosomal protein L5 [Candidatus Altiarchaeales archaeon]